jgi:eukaryotic-like serine/threonine-protein kinase
VAQVTRAAGTHRVGYLELRDAGLEELATGQVAAAIEHLAAAAILHRSSSEAHINLANAFERAGKLEAARQSLEAGLFYARQEGRPATIEQLELRLVGLPPPPPSRKDFAPRDRVYSALTNTHWTITHVIESGGMGTVYVVDDETDGRVRALKTLKSQHAWHVAARERLVREAATWVRLDPHPHIVTAEWIDVIADTPFLVMEYVEGGDLAGFLSNQALSIERALVLAMQICDAMTFAHTTLGLVHRDLKPANCLFTKQGDLKVSDFGLARIASDQRAAIFELAGIAPEHGLGLTMPRGTEPYWAPEQRDPLGVLDTRTDIHAFGVMLYEMLTRDFQADTQQADAPRGLNRARMQLMATRHDMPRRIQALILACIAPDPRNRPASFDDVRRELVSVLRKRDPRQRTTVPIPVPCDARVWNNKAVAFQALDLFAEAEACCDRALALTPDDPEILQNKGVALLCQQRYAESIAYFDRALVRMPRDPDILNNRGHAYFKLRRLDAAAESLRAAARYAGSDPLICKNLAEVLLESNQPDEALPWIRKGLDTHPQHPSLIELQGRYLLAIGEIEKALACFREGLTFASRAVGLWKGIARAQLRRAGYAEALDASNKALELSPDDVMAARYKNEALIGLGQGETPSGTETTR